MLIFIPTDLPFVVGFKDKRRGCGGNGPPCGQYDVGCGPLDEAQGWDDVTENYVVFSLVRRQYRFSSKLGIVTPFNFVDKV